MPTSTFHHCLSARKEKNSFDMSILHAHRLRESCDAEGDCHNIWFCPLGQRLRNDALHHVLNLH